MRSINISWADSTGTSGTRLASAPPLLTSAARSRSILTTGAPIPASPTATSCSPCRAPRRRPRACRLHEQAALRALEIDDRLVEAHTSLAVVRANFHWDWSGSEIEFQRALESDPSYATLHHWYSIYSLAPLGRFDEAEDEIEWAEQLDPTSLTINLGHAQTLYLAGDCPAAIAQCMKVLRLDGRYYRAYWWLGLAHDRLGNFEAASDALETARARGGGEIAFRARILGALGHTYGRWGKSDRAVGHPRRVGGYVAIELRRPIRDRACPRRARQNGCRPRQSGARRRGPVWMARLLRRVAGLRESCGRTRDFRRS